MAEHAIFQAAYFGDLKLAKKLLAADPGLITARNSKGQTPLHVAANRGQAKIARILLDLGANACGPSQGHDWTPLVCAAFRGHYDVAKLLIEFGAGTTESEGNPIHYAGQRQHKDICRLLVAHGAVDDLARSRKAIVKHLFRAAYSFDAKGVEGILSTHPALVHTKDKHGRGLLHEACTNGDIETVRVLLRFEIDVDMRDNNGQTALDRASAHSKRRIEKVLKAN